MPVSKATEDALQQSREAQEQHRQRVQQLLAVARGDALGDLVLKNARIVNVYSGEIERGDIAISGDQIAGIGAYEAKESVDLQGAFVAPGLIDAHVHIESSLCTPANFSSAVVPRGVTTVVADPHEIANVAGVAGVRYIKDASKGLPLTVVLMVPSCVPASHLADSGAAMGPREIDMLASGSSAFRGLAEVMDFPSVIAGSDGVLDKIKHFGGHTTSSRFACPIDGHAPGVTGQKLNAYVAAGIGSDHECVTVEEAKEKLSRGLYILIREATNARNLDPLLPLITPANARRICFCTDDRVPRDLLEVGSIDYMLRRAIVSGIDPIDAFRCCTLNPCEWFGLHDRGAIAPGRRADLFIFDDLKAPAARSVYAGGVEVAREGKLLRNPQAIAPPDAVRGKCNVDVSRISLQIPAKSSQIRVIGSREGQLITDSLLLPPRVVDDQVISDPLRDLLKMAVIERHRGSNGVGLGFIRGFGLKRGAIAGTVAHDHHNLVVIGCDDRSMLACVQHLQDISGGMCVCDGEKIIASLPLPIAGLMSDRPITQVREQYDELLRTARSLGSTMHDPFMAMSFMALEVIPSLKLTNQGLVDVERFELTSLFA